MKGYPHYYIKVKILKVFPIIDFDFYYKKPKEANKKINAVLVWVVFMTQTPEVNVTVVHQLLA